MSDTVLLVVAHPDDETIGVGGSIYKHQIDGDTVVAISMTNGVSSRPESHENDAKVRLDAASEASSILGFKWLQHFQFQDNAMDKHPLLDIIRAIESVKARINPTVVYTHSGADLNIDHRITLSAVATAFRPLPGEACKEIRLFETSSATDFGFIALSPPFTPNLYIEIENYWNVKEKALKCYQCELRDYPHSRSVINIRHRASVRGAEVGLGMAEAFQTLRKVIC